MFGQYDEGEDIKQGINDLASNKHYIISFDKIDPSLVFFHEGDGQMFSIITNKTKKDAEYKEMLQLINIQSIGNLVTELPDYKKFNQSEFIKSLEINYCLNLYKETKDNDIKLLLENTF